VQDPEPVRVCFVCLGNICRSPTAEGILRALVAKAGLEGRIEVDSAGTGSWHVGELPDPRTRAEARRRGLELTSRARQLRPEDFERFDYILVMDASNHADALSIAPRPGARALLERLRSFDPRAGDDLDVPDPYFGDDGFAHVFDLCETACRHLLSHLREKHGL
jgi:protein-tyrosine phosphatase